MWFFIFGPLFELVAFDQIQIIYEAWCLLQRNTRSLLISFENIAILAEILLNHISQFLPFLVLSTADVRAGVIYESIFIIQQYFRLLYFRVEFHQKLHWPIRKELLRLIRLTMLIQKTGKFIAKSAIMN